MKYHLDAGADHVDLRWRDIRRASRTDSGVAWAMISQCRDELLRTGSDQWDDVYPTASQVDVDIVAGTLWLLERHGTTVGLVTLDCAQDRVYQEVPWSYAEPALVVHRLCVGVGERGTGIAHRLMEFAEAQAARIGFASLRLDAYPGNPPAIRLYRQLGYREAGEVRMPRRSQRFICFEKAIPNAGEPTLPELSR